MKALNTLLVLALGLAVVPMLIGADESKPKPGERVRERIAESMADLNLSDEQEAKIADIRKQAMPKVSAAGKELTAILKEEGDKIEAVLTPEQKKKHSEQQEERKEHRQEGLAERIAHLNELDLTDAELAQIDKVREDSRPKLEKLMTDLGGILTAEQKEARMKALKSGESRREVRDSLNLTDEQSPKVDAIAKELVGVVRQKLEKMKSVLTPEQQEKVAGPKEERRERVRDRRAFAIANSRDLDLTDDQKAKIAEIRKEYRPKVEDAGNTLRAAVRDELTMVLAVVKQ